MNSSGKILVTGAGGCIGSALAQKLAQTGAAHLILLDHSEHELHEIELALGRIANGASHTAILGDINDGALLAEVFEEHRPRTIYHAAAFKHVPMMERNALAAIRNNVLGTLALARAAGKFQAAQLIMISTDKAVNPRSVMGVSKRIAELVLLRWSNSTTRMKALRLGNVLGSRGSVVPLFVQQIASGGPVTVTHPEVRRYFITLADAVETILALAGMDTAGIFVSDAGEAVKIVDVARRLIQDSAAARSNEIAVSFTALRPGEKLAEEMVFANESTEQTHDPRIRRVRTKQMDAGAFDAMLGELRESAERRDLGALLDVLMRMVPEYEPSALLLSQAARSYARR